MLEQGVTDQHFHWASIWGLLYLEALGMRLSQRLDAVGKGGQRQAQPLGGGHGLQAPLAAPPLLACHPRPQRSTLQAEPGSGM